MPPLVSTLYPVQRVVRSARRPPDRTAVRGDHGRIGSRGDV